MAKMPMRGANKMMRGFGRRPAEVQAERDISMAPSQSVARKPPKAMGAREVTSNKREVRRK